MNIQDLKTEIERYQEWGRLVKQIDSRRATREQRARFSELDASDYGDTRVKELLEFALEKIESLEAQVEQHKDRGDYWLERYENNDI